MASKRPAPVAGQIYKHFKGSLYQIVTIAVHTETSDKLVVYQSIEKPERVFARPLDMFMSDVDRLRYPLVKAKHRFTLLEEAKDPEPECETVCKDDSKVTEDVSEVKEVKAEEEIVVKAEEIEEESNIESNIKKDDIMETEEDDDTAKYKVDGELVLDPIVEALLDEKEFSKKIEYFELLRGKCTEEMLTTIAISLDIQFTGETIEEKYADLLKTLKMHDKYESARLRP